jgi:hypothetical protein
MRPNGEIRYLGQSQIDRSLWDRCITNAPNGLIYGHSFYLDHMADHWDALVLDDYAAVMPLPWRKKWLISYIYQPFLTAQLGLFGADANPELLGRFLTSIPKKFRLVECSLNHGNLAAPAGFGLYARTNYVLDLQAPYESLYQNYREQTQRNIRKSEKYGCTVTKDIDVKKIINLSRIYTGPISINDGKNLEALFQLLKPDDKAKSYGILSSTGELLASCVFFFSHGRAYYILVGNHPNGRTLGASHALIDAFIRDHARQELLLDFEGSDLRNLAFFYSSFGAREEPYTAIRINRLPWG